MKFTKRSIERFKEHYSKKFGKSLTDEEAERCASRLMEVYRVVYGVPIVGESFDNKKESED